MAQKKYIGDLFLSSRWYLTLGACVVLLFLSFFIPILYPPVAAFTGGVLLLTLIDYILLFFVNGSITATRTMFPRFSIGDENNVSLSLYNAYPFKVNGILIDELPFQFQDRNFNLSVSIGYRSKKDIIYKLKPLTRGEFKFGYLLC